MGDRFKTDAPPATPRQIDLAVITSEECTEVLEHLLQHLLGVQHRLAKLVRFGPSEMQPGDLMNNTQRASREVGDLLEVIDLATCEGLFDPVEIAAARAIKREKLKHYMMTDPAEVV